MSVGDICDFFFSLEEKYNLNYQEFQGCFAWQLIRIYLYYNITQKIVSESLEKIKCTRVVIAHRLSTIKNCDRIIMLEKGEIIESGTYDELIDKNGKFAAMVKRQLL